MGVKALYGFFGDKFNINPSDINKEVIKDKLQGNKVDSSLIAETEEILNQCEMARFSPMSNIDTSTVYENALNLLSNIQKGLK